MSITVSKTFPTEAEAIAWLNGGGTPAATSGKAETGKPETGKPAAKTASKPKISKDDIDTILNKVKDDLGVATAKGIINEIGGVKKMDDIPEAKYAAVLKAAQEKLDEAAEAGDDGEDDGGI